MSRWRINWNKHFVNPKSNWRMGEEHGVGAVLQCVGMVDTSWSQSVEKHRHLFYYHIWDEFDTYAQNVAH